MLSNEPLRQISYMIHNHLYQQEKALDGVDEGVLGLGK
jgi:hypothetical protein